ncbi:kinetochore Sim4 complex subunit Fta4, partial [Terfezia claveryi]
STLFTIKKPFLDSQIRLLSADLAPPPNWQDAIPAGPGGDLSQRAIDQVLTKVNLIAKKHNRSVYSSQTVKRVAEQIEAAYGGAGGGENEEGRGGYGEVPGEEEVLRRGVDLMDVDTISLLPEDYPVNPSTPGPQPSEAELSRYQTLRARLLHASTSFKAQRSRYEYYAQLQEKLRPFSEPHKVQPNLVTRGAELDREMERMRGLALKLSVQIERA